MKPLFLCILVSLGFTISAQAAMDVTCVDGDCLTYGWDIADMASGRQSTIRCTDNDCVTAGWVGAINERPTGEIICKPRGCFSEGWRMFAINGAQTGEVVCRRGYGGVQDCLSYGWDTFTATMRYPTVCINDDCQNRGWESVAPGYPAQVIRCKMGGCFNSGWTVRP